MPKYTFRCEKCGKEIEMDYLPDDNDLIIHVDDSGTYKRIYLPPYVVFKGRGFTKSIKGNDER